MTTPRIPPSAQGYREFPPEDRAWTDHQLFHGLGNDTLRSISQYVTIRQYSAGSKIVDQGDEATHLFIVRSGQAQILYDVGGQQVPVNTLQRPDIFGEMGLLTDGRRSAAVRALTNLDVITIAKEGFDILISQNFSIATDLVRLHNQRTLDLQRHEVQVTGNLPRRGTGTGMLNAPEVHRIIAVFSPSGGTGKTMIATNMAVGLARRYPHRVALLDLSLTGSQCGLILNAGNKASLMQYSSGDLSHFDNMDAVTWQTDICSRHNSGLSIATMAHSPLEAVTVTAAHVEGILKHLGEVFPWVIVDMTSCYADPNLMALNKATHIFLISNYELTSLRCLIECVSAIDDPDNPVTQRSSLILNATKPRPAVAPKDFESRVRIPLRVQLPYGEDAPSLSARDGTPLVDKYPQLPLSRELLQLAEKIVDAPKPVGTGTLPARDS